METKPRCEKELHIEKYFGLPADTSPEQPMQLKYADLVDLLYSWEQRITPPHTSAGGEEKLVSTLKEVLKIITEEKGVSHKTWQESALEEAIEKLSLPQPDKGWVMVEERLPEMDVRVLCWYESSDNHFICWRTNDCSTGEEKWCGGATPTHWQYLTTPNKKQ